MTKVVTSGGSQTNARGTLRPIGTFAGDFNPASGLPTDGTGRSNAILKGDYWLANASGTIAGLDPFTDFEEGDLIFAKVNGASVVSEFFGNKGTGGGSGSGDVTGPASSTDDELVLFSGLTGKIIKAGGVVVSAFAKTILDDANAAAVRSTIGAQASLGFTPSRRLLLNFNTTTSVTGTTNETRLTSAPVPAGTIQVGDVINIRAFFSKTGTAGSGTHRVSTNTTDDLAGSPIRLGLVNNGAATGVHTAKIAREFPVKASNSMSNPVAGTSNANNDVSAFGVAVSTFATNWAVDQYIIFSSQLGSGSDTASLQSAYVEIIR